MSIVCINNVKIRGISTAVPSKKIDNLTCNKNFSLAESEKFIKTTGIRFRRIAGDKQTTSDLGYAAAVNLLKKIDINKNDIDALIFVSQTADYILPASSIILQNRLNLSKSTIAFDVSLGCTGYVYGLYIAASLLNSGQLKNVLLICGDTPSKYVSQNDRSSVLLLGDAASATIIGRGSENMVFSLNSDGSGSDVLKIKSGMFRNPINKDSLEQYKWHDGNIRADNQLFMDGAEVFNFTIREVAKDIKNILNFVKLEFKDFDYIIYHQANKFINDFISKQLKIPLSKTPYSLYEYGNTSTATIPLTITHSLYKRGYNLKLILSAFGVGLSWGSCIMELEKDACILPIFEV
jgi:3-oxoacyl-[acyl-carrier-protein] synthase III